MMKVRILSNLGNPYPPYMEDQIVEDGDEKVIAELLAKGLAVKVVDEPAKATTNQPSPETFNQNPHEDNYTRTRKGHRA